MPQHVKDIVRDRDQAASVLIGLVIALALLSLLAAGVATVLRQSVPEAATIEEIELQDVADQTLQRLIGTPGAPARWTTVSDASSLGLLNATDPNNVLDLAKITALDGASQADLRGRLGVDSNVNMSLHISWGPLDRGLPVDHDPWYLGDNVHEPAWLRQVMPGFKNRTFTERDDADPTTSSPAAFPLLDADRSPGNLLLLEQFLVQAAGFSATETQSSVSNYTGTYGTTAWRVYPTDTFTGLGDDTDVVLATGYPTSGVGSTPNQFDINRYTSATLFLTDVPLHGASQNWLELEQQVRGKNEVNFDYQGTAYVRAHGASGAWTSITTWRALNSWTVSKVAIPSSFNNSTVDLAFHWVSDCRLPEVSSACDQQGDGWFLRRLVVNGTRAEGNTTFWAWNGTLDQVPPLVVLGSGLNGTEWHSTGNAPTLGPTLGLLRDRGARFLALGPADDSTATWSDEIDLTYGAYTGPLNVADPDLWVLTHPNRVDGNHSSLTASLHQGTWSIDLAGATISSPVRESGASPDAVLTWTKDLVATTYRPGHAPFGEGQVLFENVAHAVYTNASIVQAGVPRQFLPIDNMGISTTAIAVAQANAPVAPGADGRLPGFATIKVYVWR